MRSFFVSPGTLSQPIFALKPEDARHVAGPLRMRAGDTVTVFDGAGDAAEAQLEEVSPKNVTVRVVSRRQIEPPAGTVTLLQGLTKSGKFDLVIEKATELGISKIVPVLCERTVVELKGGKEESKVSRWQRLAEEAAKQCGRPTIPDIATPAKLTQLFSGGEHAFDRLIVPWEERAGEAGAISEHLLRGAANIAVLIGPEGGLTEDEVAAAKEAGGVVVSLGPNILRSETAAIAAITLITHFLRATGARGGDA